LIRTKNGRRGCPDLKARDVKVEEILDDGIIRELDESAFLKPSG